MSRRKKIAIMAIVSFWSAVTTAIVLALIAKFGTVPSYIIPWTNLVLSRWWDILFLPIYLDIFLVAFLFLVPYLKNRYRIKGEERCHVDAGHVSWTVVALVVGLTAGLAYGFVAGFVVGLWYGFAAEFAVVLAVGLLAEFAVGLTAGLILLIKGVIAFHKRLLNDL